MVTRVNILIFPNVEELDFIGPFEIFNFVNDIRPGSTEVRLVATSTEPLRCRNGLRVLSDYVLEEALEADLLLVPGGDGRKAAMRDGRIVGWIAERAARGEIVASICTGAFLLGNAGLLAGKRATTYHGCLDEFAAAFPDITVVCERVVDEGKVLTAAGVTSGMDLSFHLLARFFGAEVARRTAEGIEFTPQAG